MSDGDNATPGRPRGSGDDESDQGANQWLTRAARPPRAAAPWERLTVSESTPTGAEPRLGGGNHTDGVTVADLIAKVGAPRQRPPSAARRATSRATPTAAAASARRRRGGIPSITASEIPEPHREPVHRRAEAHPHGKPRHEPTWRLAAHAGRVRRAAATGHEPATAAVSAAARS